MKQCIVCHWELTPTELRSCASCVTETRADLFAIEVAYRLLPDMLGGPAAVPLGTVMGIGSDDAPLPGGDILVMLGPGSAMNGRHPHSGDPNDPPVVAFELATWCEDWAGLRGEQTGWLPNTVASCVPWLNVRLGWAMDHHPVAEHFVADMERIRQRLEDATGMGDRPERGETCPRCGDTVERRWTKNGRDDDWSCPGCKRVYTPAELRHAILSVLAQNESVG